MREKGDVPIYFDTLPAGNFGPKQPEAVGMIAQMPGLFADLEMDEEVAYEIVRIAYEHGAEFKSYHRALAGLEIKERLGWVAPEDFMHPGAVRFYKEKGIKIGPKISFEEDAHFATLNSHLSSWALNSKRD